MKFTKEEAVKELSAKYKPRYGDPAKWERTINESVEHAMAFIGEDSEIELGDFIGKVTPFLDTTAGFVLKETAAVATNKQQELEELKKQLEGKKEDKTDADDALLKRIEALEKREEESRRLESVSRKRDEITAKLKEKGVKDTDWIDLMLKKATIADDTDTEKEAGEYLEIYNKMHANKGEDQTPPPAKGEPSDKAMAAIEKAAQIAKDRIA